jgi:hypothetical protein
LFFSYVQEDVRSSARSSLGVAMELQCCTGALGDGDRVLTGRARCSREARCRCSSRCSCAGASLYPAASLPGDGVNHFFSGELHGRWTMAVATGGSEHGK